MKLNRRIWLLFIVNALFLPNLNTLQTKAASTKSSSTKHVSAKTTKIVKPQNANAKTDADKIVVSRPQYKMSLNVDIEKLTLQNVAEITVPVMTGDVLRDVSFFIYANADGVGGATKSTPNIVVERVEMNGKTLKFASDGAVLRVTLPELQRQNFTLKITTHGTIPRAPAGSEGLGGMLAGMDLGSLFGGTSSTQTKPKNADYGLYTFGGDILSLGAFWYPTLAIRRDGKWLDAQPEGLGDVSYAQLSDYVVNIDVAHDEKTPLLIATPAISLNPLISRRAKTGHTFGTILGNCMREFPILMSKKYQTKSKTFDVAGQSVSVSAFTTQFNAAKTDAAIEIAGHALQIYAKRFGPYRYNTFTIAEAPIRGGAGGMEYSGMTGIASMLYGNMSAQLGGFGDLFGASSTQSSAAKTPLGDVLAQQKTVLDSVFEETIAHEVAHQWWAIGVGSDSEGAPWLDESLTNYSSMIYWEDRYGAARAKEMSDAHLKSAYTAARMFGTPDARGNLSSSKYVNSLQYGAVVYGKGALFYGALRQLVGDAAFFAALKNYYEEFNGKLANETSLRVIFKAKSPQNSAKIDALYRRWIEEAHGDADINGGKAPSFGDLLSGMFG